MVSALAGCRTARPEPDEPSSPVSSQPSATAPAAPVIAQTNPAPEVPASPQEELNKLMEADDTAQAEVDGWILENREFAARGAAIPNDELNRRIIERFLPVRQGYEDFIKRYPTNAEVRLAYASLLHDFGEEDLEVELLEKARELDPTIPAVWNQLANYYGHRGPVTNAFRYYEKAIELEPTEPVYYQNFATTVYLFRKDAREYYSITEPQVFDKALELYTQALKLDPTNYPLATDLAISYYAIKPLRTNDALQSWTNALAIAHDDIEREGVYIHLARIKLNVGWLEEARAHLDAVKHEMYNELKKRLVRNLNEKEAEARDPNSATNTGARWIGLIPGETNAPPAEDAGTNAPQR